MLKSPDAYLSDLGLTTRRGLANEVYKNILASVSDLPKTSSMQLFPRAFHGTHGPKTLQRLQKRIRTSIPQLEGGNTFVLPPLCLRCSQNFIVLYTKDIPMYLMGDMDSRGIFPVVSAESVRKFTHNSDALLHMFVQLYSFASYDFVTVDNLEQMLIPL